MKGYKRLSAILAAGAVSLCGLAFPASADDGRSDDIIILYTNDVHCGIDDHIGYDGLMLYKREMEALYGNVLLADAGDAISGAPVGSLSNGKYITRLMNAVGYDVATVGNHEFDYEVSELMLRADELNCGYICANFLSRETGELVFEPYKLFETGDKKVAFVGAATPETLIESTPTFFQNDEGEYIYSFGEDGSLYSLLQNAVDAARADGADYVVILGHLGESNITDGWSAPEIAAELTGIDVIIDGHSHEVTPGMTVKSKDGCDVLITQTGTKLNNIGKLTISPDGSMKTELVSSVPAPDESMGLAEDSWTEDSAHPGVFVDEAVSLEILDIKEALADELSRRVGSTAYTLTDSDPDTGLRAVRNAETNLSDFCADAFREVLGADIGFINGGAVRAAIEAGDITFNDLLSVFPYGNSTAVAEVTGQQILDLLENGACELPGESGSFIHVSGASYCVDDSIPSSVVRNDKGIFTGVDGAYRVSNVLVNGEPLDPDGKYIVASADYFLKNGGDGGIISGNCTIVKDDIMPDTDVLINYLNDVLGGEVPDKYSDPHGEGRITKGTAPAAPAGSLSLEVSSDRSECNTGDEFIVTITAVNTGSAPLTDVAVYFEDTPVYTAEALEEGKKAEVSIRLRATEADIETGGIIHISASAGGLAEPVAATLTVRVLPAEANPATGSTDIGFALMIFAGAAVLVSRKRRER